jgi:Raf kinase inhibitor-like YbhB/YbcL family protein
VSGIVRMHRFAFAATLGVASLLATNVLMAQTPPGAPAAQPAPPGGRGGMRVLTLTTTAFADGGMIPEKHTQAGRDVSPALSWTGAPDSTVSFVLIVRDADAALGNGMDDMLHWLVWNIPGSATSLPEGVPPGGQGTSTMRQISASGPYYRGPAAPSTGPAHHYIFELYALDGNVNVPAVGMSPPATRAAVMAAMAGRIRGKGVLVGLYRRPAP